MSNQTQNSSFNLTTGLIDYNWVNEALSLEQTGKMEAVRPSQIKRFMERWTADPNFRKQVFAEPYKAIISYGIKVIPEQIRPLWDLNFTKELNEELSVSASLKCWQKFTDENRTHRVTKSIAGNSIEPRFKAWRERQIARTTRKFKKQLGDDILHANVCFELSKGCSIGCSFCGISAPRLNDIFFYTQENAKLWREILELIKNILGHSASAGFCYWATDPFDNPDYEKFCSDFHEILGIFPPTTTAQPLKNPERTRSLLKLSSQKGCSVNRFSILSLKMLNQVHEEFTPDELAFVSLALQNKEADTIKANAGRARERNFKKEEKDNDLPEQGTIACVTGFLFNMVDQSVKLISPCNADDRWPLGYITYDEGTFSNAEDLKILLEKMIAKNMSLMVRPDDIISFPRDIKYESFSDGFHLSTKFKTYKFRNDPYFKELGEVIKNGDKTAEEIVALFNVCGISPTHTLNTLNLLLKKGVLDDEPKMEVIQLKI
ncbi:radical SAM family RiPP maturation amino acid epimerase [Nostoc sp.]|uniref:radical SAM family RiPP maturation amino acid epimerase n=1 Tax=Nostoc sp. TaxID=1180 RepID=UPI002FFBD561